MSGDKLLIVGPSWVGDMVMAQALYRVLWERRSAPEIHVLAPAWSKPVLARMPEVARAIEMPAGHGELALRARLALGRKLRAEGYRQAIVLPRSLKSALVPFFASVPVRTGFKGEWRYGLINDMRPFDPTALNQTVKRLVALGMAPGEPLLDALPVPALRSDPEHLSALRGGLGLSSGRRAVALMPGAEYGPAKRWPADRFGALARRAAELGAEVWILGSAKDAPLGAEVKQLAAHPSVHDLSGRTTLEDVVDLLSAADVAVTNDSGLMHVAAAAGTHVVAIYGSSSPGFTPPLTERKDVHYLGIECSPCFQRHCPLGHLRCLMEISVDQVWDSVIGALGVPRASRVRHIE